ncbi:MAG: DUF721 domain-containing protein [Thermodesulfobacteriota bacterium]|nr:DUF721 domain-containing protein [Thermodesulfobacteriota bacterium]
MSSDRSKTGFDHIGDLLGNTIEKMFAEGGAPISHIWSVWEEVVGASVAQNAQPVSLKGNTLIVHVASATWNHQLQFLKPDIIRRINQTVDTPLFTDIKFRIGDLE